ncbi:hypothetical protein NEP02_24580 [Escherichia coli]|uniref:Uncharacterized protein n=2 Tax=Escherichia coli TaxID=562 RepID=A0A6G4C7U6_ECOLX|nr:hypothetical protein [Escherichia coli]EBN2255102.1 hypothetical protein [Salmonella enterica]EEO4659902.1 hypothetical protein [Salmonella enterica subsp. enterica]EEJ0052602.1 hypothetical protein [Salmonella enterica]EFC9690653.1 hypothetical protein [Escherichia coli]EFH4991388.1 hypothetical protein [Escherichia coli]
MGSCAAPSAKGDDKFITTDYLQQCLISEGDYFEELKELFTLYCDSCPGWELNGRLIKHFTVQNEPRFTNGRWVSHPCYKVQLSNGELRPFSVEKAIDAIVKAAAADQQK